MQPDTMKDNSAGMSSDTQELKQANCYCFLLSYLKGNNFWRVTTKNKIIQLKDEEVKK